MDKRTLVAVTLIPLLLVVDQAVKIAVKTSMLLYESIEIWPWFRITFTENRGMAFGMEFVGTYFLALFRILAIAAFVWVLIQAVRRRYPVGLIVCLSMIIAGASGNILDNCFYGLGFEESHPVGYPFAAPARWVGLGAGYGDFLSGKVVDMFYFPLFTWPGWLPFVGGQVFFGAIFNFADACISVGAVSLVLFYNKFLLQRR